MMGITLINASTNIGYVAVCSKKGAQQRERAGIEVRYRFSVKCFLNGLARESHGKERHRQQ